MMKRESKLREPASRYRVPWWEERLDRLVLALGRSPWGESGLGRPRGIMHVFQFVERVLVRLHPSQPLRPGGIVLYEVLRYPGRSLPLPGRAAVRKGELVIGLHFDNQVLASLDAAEPSVSALTWRLNRIGAEDLRVLAQKVNDGAFPPGIRAVWGETLIYRALRRLGFTIRPSSPSLRTSFARLFLLSMLATYGRPGQLDSERGLAQLRLGDAWMSVDELRRRFRADTSNAENAQEVGDFGLDGLTDSSPSRARTQATVSE
jgi:hypothetical protein